MDLETLPEAGAPAEQVAPVVAENPEIATPETDQQEESPEQKAQAERDKAIKNLQRRVDRKHAQAAAAEERARLAEQRAAEIEARYSGGEQEKPQIDPIQLAREIATVERVTEKSNAVARDGAKRFPDFNQALSGLVEEVGPLFDQRGRPNAIGEAILDADDPAALLHHLGVNSDVAADLVGLSPIQVARRIAKLEIELKQPKEPKQSNAPKPITPVRSAAETSGLSDSLSTEEWRRRFYKMRRGG
jgi:hypothetical protein